MSEKPHEQKSNLRLVQFLHPGGEHSPDRSGWKDWNRGPHRRKFMACEGRHIDNGAVQDRLISFWGEWEPPSVVERIYPPVKGGPRWLHRPVFDLVSCTDDGLPFQNTDPFVFGPHFHYSICHQLRRIKSADSGSIKSFYRPTVLNGGIGRGSVILFGSHIQGQFVLDTVFVVAAAIPYNPRRPSQKILRHIDPIYKACVHDCLSIMDVTLTLYCGATYDNPVESMYSYIPCKPVSQSNVIAGWKRPIVRLPRYVLDGLSRPFRSSKLSSLKHAFEIWQNILNQVHTCGLFPGTYIYEPLKRGQINGN